MFFLIFFSLDAAIEKQSEVCLLHRLFYPETHQIMKMEKGDSWLKEYCVVLNPRVNDLHLLNYEQIRCLKI